MDNINNLPNQYIKNLYRVTLAFLVILCLFFAVKLMAEFKSYGSSGNKDANTITLSGHGEVSAVPDIASVYFTIRKEGKTVKEAQEAVALIEKKALDFLKSSKVDEKDIKASNASFNPVTEYVYDTKISMPCSEYSCPPRPGKSTITGYQAYESINVKLRAPDSVGEIIQGLGTLGVTELNGPNYTIDNEDGLKAEARKKAIDDAREKAKVLANDLGVQLGGIASFSESGNNYPIYYSKGAEMSLDSAVAPAPAEIPKGENTISSDVTIVYEIR